MKLFHLWNQYHSDRERSKGTSGNQMVEFQFKHSWSGYDKSSNVLFFFADQHRLQTLFRNSLMGKATLIHNRKLSILHLFAAVVIQFLSFPLTASFAFSISGVYFLFEDRVTTVIPFVPLLPNGKNKCLLCFSFSKECFSSFSRRIQPDFLRS